MFPIRLASDADIQGFAERMFKVAAENPVCLAKGLRNCLKSKRLAM